MPGPGGHHGGPGGRGGMGGGMHRGPGPRGGMHGGHQGGPRGGMGHRPMGFGGMHHHRPAPPPPPPMHHGGYPRRPYRGGCCGCAIPALALAFAGIAGILSILL